MSYPGTRLPPLFITPRPIYRRRGFWSSLWYGLVSVIGGPFALIWDIFRPHARPRLERRWVMGHMTVASLLIVITVGAWLVDGFAVYRASQTMTHYIKLHAKAKPPAYGDLINLYAARHNLDPALVAAVIAQESNFDPNCVSPSGARGLMQLMPATWRSLMPDSSCSGDHPPPAREPDCIFDPEANIRAGTLQLRYLLDSYGDNLVLVLAAYNNGSARVTASERPADLGRYPANEETEKYIRGVLSDWTRLSDNPIGVISLRMVIWARRALPWFGGATIALWAATFAWLARRYV